MLTILIDAGVLIALLKGITDEDVSIGLACVIARARRSVWPAWRLGWQNRSGPSGR